MKEIVKNSNIEVINFDNFILNMYDIIAYETKAKNGLAILVKIPSREGFGFIYHSDLVKCKFNNVKFIHTLALDSIDDALNCGRTVLAFDSFQEFCKHSSKFNY